ncbi:protein STRICTOSIDINE SYNTHASE-LIKE 12 [Citrus sinensis]|nr:protein STRICTOSIDINE SYNTHASE-LIKE 12-like [Citrus sinensis]KAH9722429.1 protein STRICTOSIDINE SYNTHASE-LIKE 12 [Citrus sinensis]
MVFSIPTFTKILFPPKAFGGESIAFEPVGGAFYTGVADGRILKYQAPDGFTDFAFTTPTRSKAVCDGTTNLDLGPICGRTFGLALHYATRQLYIADAYSGLLVDGPNGRLATQLATGAEGQAFHFLDGLDVDQGTGIVYFTDASGAYDFRTIVKLNITNDSTGRLLSYNPRSSQVTVLLRNLTGPVGVAISVDSSFLLVSEFTENRTLKYWLRGPRANSFDIINFQAKPDNIKRNPGLLQTFWEAAIITRQPAGTPVPIGQRISAFGAVLDTISFEAQYGTTPISEVQPFGGALYISSRSTDFVGVLRP